MAPRRRSKSPAPRKAAEEEEEEVMEEEIEEDEEEEDDDDLQEDKEEEKEEDEKEDHFEFGGPAGAVATMISLPFVVLFLYYGASKEYKFSFTNLGGFVEIVRKKHLKDLFSSEAWTVCVRWFLFQVLLERLLFAEKAKGVELPTGERLTYRINGHLAFWFSLLVMGHGKIDAKNQLSLGSFQLEWIYENYVQLAMAASALSTLLAVFLFAKSYTEGALLAKGGNTRNHVYNFFIGRELNPRDFRTFDWKFFCELRPGLIGWVIINLGCLMAQRKELGKGNVTPEMILINIFQGLYVWDALYHERSILTTMDITTDGFGWMLAFGDLAWVPFTYSLQARYLVKNSPGLSVPTLVAICILNFVGYGIFRMANLEKDMFRRDPDGDEVKHLKTMTTKSGRKLLISGWWGTARKINYTADLMMGLAWCALTGTETILTYFYFIYFAILLVHRAYRDDHACSLKYGADWDKYKEKVPYLFIPGII